jgi:hypothetical protein
MGWFAVVQLTLSSPCSVVWAVFSSPPALAEHPERRPIATTPITPHSRPTRDTLRPFFMP